MDQFEYSRINLDRPSFRLLRLAADNGPTIECEIFQSFLATEGGVPYEALSYTWGGGEKPETIIANGKMLSVTINLHQALNHLRLPHCDRILWIDALCIDQENVRERTHQVGQMANIYKNAECVIYWLGQATYSTNVALDSLKALEKMSASVSCETWTTINGNIDERWQLLWSSCQPRLERKYPDLIQNQQDGLRDLLQRPWFERVWIIQEVANSKRAVVQCGAKCVSASIFALSCGLFAMEPSEHVRAILDIMPSHSRRELWLGKAHDLYSLLCKFRSSKAQDPRDRVYALLGIASDPDIGKDLKPDYEKMERDVIRDCVLYFCKLDIEKLPEFAIGYWNSMIDDETMQGFLESIDSLYVAAMDQHLRVPSTEDSRYFVISRGHNVHIANEMLELSTKHGAESKALLEMLIHSHADLSMLENAARNWQNLEWLDVLLGALPERIENLESILVAASRNLACGKALRRIVKSRRDEAHLTDTLLNAAASASSTKTALVTLSKLFGSEFRVTEDMITRLENNDSPQSLMALSYLGLHPGLPSQLTKRIALASRRKLINKAEALGLIR